MAERIPRPGAQHPDQWREDLNPNPLAGANYGPATEEPFQSGRTAYDVKDLHRRLRDLADNQLKQITVVPTGTRLEQGATYIDLANDSPNEFTATGDMQAGPSNCYAAKSETDYELWNRLIGVTNPERLGRAR
jgi:hypothetical protein